MTDNPVHSLEALAQEIWDKRTLELGDNLAAFDRLATLEFDGGGLEGVYELPRDANTYTPEELFEELTQGDSCYKLC